MKKFIFGILIFLLLGSVSAFSQVYVGMEAPEIDAEEWINTNEDISLEELRGEVVVVEFWATWCGPCLATIPHLIELNDEYSDQGVVIVSLTDEDRRGAEIDDFMESMGMDYIVGTGSRTSSTYGVTGIPHAVVINRDGLIVWEGHPADDLEAGIESALSGEAPPAPPEMVDMDEVDLKKVRIGQTIEGELESSDSFVYGTYVDGYVIEAPEGTVVDISISSLDIDSVLELVDYEGMEYMNDDADVSMPNTTDSFYTFAFTESGMLNIYVTSYDTGETGDYTLDIQISTGEAQNTAPGLEDVEMVEIDIETINGALEYSDTAIWGQYVDGYLIEGYEGMPLSITLTSDDFDTVLDLIDPEGMEFGNDDADIPLPNSTDSFIEYTFSTEGDLLIYVFSYYPEEVGEYTLTLESMEEGK